MNTMSPTLDQSPAATGLRHHSLPLLYLLLLACLPALTTWSSFYLEILPYLIYPLAKVLLIVLPFAVWHIWQGRWTAGLAGMGLSRPTWRGLISGLALSGGIVACYLLFLPELDSSGIRHKLSSLGLLNYYFLASFFILALNSALEEWYWRGFLLAQLKNHVKKPAVVIGLSGLFFGFHHFFTLLPYFSLGLTLVFTGATMLAGAIWSWQRMQGWSLADCYISHLVADATIVGIGATLLF